MIKQRRPLTESIEDTKEDARAKLARLSRVVIEMWGRVDNKEYMVDARKGSLVRDYCTDDPRVEVLFDDPLTRIAMGRKWSAPSSVDLPVNERIVGVIGSGENAKPVISWLFVRALVETPSVEPAALPES